MAARETSEAEPLPASTSAYQYAAELPAMVKSYTDPNWFLGVTLGLPAGVLLDIAPDKVRAGDDIRLPDGTVRTVLRLWGSQLGGSEVFLTGNTLLNPATQGGGLQARVLVAKALPPVVPVSVDEAQAIGRAYEAAHPEAQGGGLLDNLAKAVSSVGGAVEAVVQAAGSAANTAANTAGALVDAAQHSVAAQVAAAVLTGGTSLVAQAAVETATGKGGPITSTATDLIEHPGDALSKLPGDVLVGTGLPAVALNAVSALGAAAQGAFGADSGVGKAGAAARAASEQVQDSARDNPVAVGETFVGAAGLALGIPGAKNLLRDGLTTILGGPKRQQEQSAQQSQEAPAADAQAATAPLSSAPAAQGRRWKPVAGGLLLITGAGLTMAWALSGNRRAA